MCRTWSRACQLRVFWRLQVHCLVAESGSCQPLPPFHCTVSADCRRRRHRRAKQTGYGQCSRAKSCACRCAVIPIPRNSEICTPSIRGLERLKMTDGRNAFEAKVYCQIIFSGDGGWAQRPPSAAAGRRQSCSAAFGGRTLSRVGRPPSAADQLCRPRGDPTLKRYRRKLPLRPGPGGGLKR